MYIVNVMDKVSFACVKVGFCAPSYLNVKQADI